MRIAGNRGIALLEVSRAELDRRTGGILHQGIALQVPPFAYHALPDLLREARRGRGAAAARRARRRHRPAQPGRGDPLGAGLRRARRDHSRAALGRRDGDGLAHVGRRGGAAAGGAGDEPGPRAQGLPRRRAVRARPRRRRHDDRSTISRWPPSRSSSSSAPRAAGCRGWSARPATSRVSIPMAPAAESLNASVAAAVTLAEIARRRGLTRRALAALRRNSPRVAPQRGHAAGRQRELRRMTLPVAVRDNGVARSAATAPAPCSTRAARPRTPATRPRSPPRAHHDGRRPPARGRRRRHRTPHIRSPAGCSSSTASISAG